VPREVTHLPQRAARVNPLRDTEQALLHLVEFSSLQPRGEVTLDLLDQFETVARRCLPRGVKCTTVVRASCGEFRRSTSPQRSISRRSWPEAPRNAKGSDAVLTAPSTAA
jgi:hypothetical protein